MSEIDPSNPVDKIAAMVVSKVNHSVVRFNPGHQVYSMTPLPIRQFPGFKQHDLTGRKSGRYTVIGCAIFVPKNHLTSTNNIRWVVKCSCGRYGHLTTKGVKNNSPNTMCSECSKTNHLRFRASSPSPD